MRLFARLRPLNLICHLDTGRLFGRRGTRSCRGGSYILTYLPKFSPPSDALKSAALFVSQKGRIRSHSYNRFARNYVRKFGISCSAVLARPHTQVLEFHQTACYVFFLTITENVGDRQTERKGAAPAPPATGREMNGLYLADSHRSILAGFSYRRSEKASPNSQNPVSISNWSRPLPTGSDLQTEFAVTPRKQSPEKFLTGARTAFRNSARPLLTSHSNHLFVCRNTSFTRLFSHLKSAELNRQIRESERCNLQKTKGGGLLKSPKNPKTRNSRPAAFGGIPRAFSNSSAMQIQIRTANAPTEIEF